MEASNMLYFNKYRILAFKSDSLLCSSNGYKTSGTGEPWIHPHLCMLIASIMRPPAFTKYACWDIQNQRQNAKKFWLSLVLIIAVVFPPCYFG